MCLCLWCETFSFQIFMLETLLQYLALKYPQSICKHPVWLCTIYWKFCVDLCVVDVEITLPVWDIAHHVMRRNVTGVPVWRHIRSKDPLERCGPHGEPSGVGVSKDPPSVPNGKSWQSSLEYQGKHSLGTWKCKSGICSVCTFIVDL